MQSSAMSTSILGLAQVAAGTISPLSMATHTNITSIRLSWYFARYFETHLFKRLLPLEMKASVNELRPG